MSRALYQPPTDTRTRAGGVSIVMLLAHHEHTIHLGAALVPLAPFALAAAAAWLRSIRSTDPTIHTAPKGKE